MLARLLNLHDLIRFNVLDLRNLSVWPPHFERVDLCRGPEPEVKAHVILRDVARSALHQTTLGQRSGSRGRDGADRVGVARCAGQLHQQPVAAVGQLVVEELRTAVKIVDHDIETAVIVEIADRQPAAHSFVAQNGPELRRHLVERAIAAVVVQQLALAISG